LRHVEATGEIWQGTSQAGIQRTLQTLWRTPAALSAPTSPVPQTLTLLCSCSLETHAFIPPAVRWHRHLRSDCPSNDMRVAPAARTVGACRELAAMQAARVWSVAWCGPVVTHGVPSVSQVLSDDLIAAVNFQTHQHAITPSARLLPLAAGLSVPQTAGCWFIAHAVDRLQQPHQKLMWGGPCNNCMV
jgi:hypothetical protein